MGRAGSDCKCRDQRPYNEELPEGGETRSLSGVFHKKYHMTVEIFCENINPSTEEQGLSGIKIEKRYV